MVSVTNEATGESRSALTSETGNFSFPSLLPATYTIRVELAGFQTFQRTGNILTPNSRLDVGELKLTIGAVGETINVEASVAQVQTASAENSALLTRDQFSMIPTKGRDLTNMLRLLARRSDDRRSRCLWRRDGIRGDDRMPCKARAAPSRT